MFLLNTRLYLVGSCSQTDVCSRVNFSDRPGFNLSLFDTELSRGLDDGIVRVKIFKMAVLMWNLVSFTAGGTGNAAAVFGSTSRSECSDDLKK